MRGNRIAAKRMSILPGMAIAIMAIGITAVVVGIAFGHILISGIGLGVICFSSFLAVYCFLSPYSAKKR